MNEIQQLTFDYSALPADIGASLRVRADKIFAVRNRAIYDIGKELSEAQEELSSHRSGCFGQWVSSLGISRQHAYDLIGLYKNAGDSIVKLLDNKKMTQTVALFLSRESTPESVVEKATEKAAAGEKVSVADVQRWKAEAEKAKTQVSTLQAALREAVNRPPKVEVQEVVREVVPQDYQQAKQKAEALKAELAKNKDSLDRLKKEQAAAIEKGIKDQMDFRKNEIVDLERSKSVLEARISELAAFHKRNNDREAIIKYNSSVRASLRDAITQFYIDLCEMEFVDDEREKKNWKTLIYALKSVTRAAEDAVFLGSKPDPENIQDGGSEE